MATVVNAELTLLYQHILQNERAEYGKEIIGKLSANLTAQFGKGWSKRNLAQMVKFAVAFPEIQIVQALRAQLSWTHFKQLAYIERLHLAVEKAKARFLAKKEE